MPMLWMFSERERSSGRTQPQDGNNTPSKQAPNKPSKHSRPICAQPPTRTRTVSSMKRRKVGEAREPPGSSSCVISYDSLKGAVSKPRLPPAGGGGWWGKRVRRFEHEPAMQQRRWRGKLQPHMERGDEHHGDTLSPQMGRCVHTAAHACPPKHSRSGTSGAHPGRCPGCTQSRCAGSGPGCPASGCRCAGPWPTAPGAGMGAGHPQSMARPYIPACAWPAKQTPAHQPHPPRPPANPHQDVGSNRVGGAGFQEVLARGLKAARPGHAKLVLEDLKQPAVKHLALAVREMEETCKVVSAGHKGCQMLPG